MMISRRTFISTYATGVALLGYAGVMEPRWLTVRQHSFRVPHLPAAYHGYQIAQLSDFHYTPQMRGLVEQAIGQVMAWQPDLIALTGDFIDENTGDHLDELLQVLTPLKARDGVLGVLGNHDLPGSPVEELRRRFASSSVKLLVNEMYLQGELEVIGLDSIYVGSPNFNLPLTSAQPKGLRIVLAHEPDTFDQVCASYHPHLQLSGHTHGGQCRVPLVGYAPYMPRYGRQYPDGAYQTQQSQLFVSSGLGTSILPFRFACRPEIVLIKLEPQ